MISNLFTIAGANLLPLIIAFIIGVATGWWAWARYRVEADYDGADYEVEAAPAPAPEPVTVPIAAPPPPPMPAAAPVAALGLTAIGIPAAIGAADNLMAIKGIGPKLNGILNGLGVTRFDQIAAWGPAEVDKVDDHLEDFRNRIGRDEWVPQAQLLAAGKTDEWTRVYGTAKAAPASPSAPAAAPAAVALTAIGIPAAVGDPDNLLQIKGVGPKLNALLISLGITRFDQIAAWGQPEVDTVDSHLGNFKDRITRDAWVEQAGLLATGAIAQFEAKFGKLDSENK
jgi:predicted flap endonuclease-1-like 5' DNA nuclease